MPGPIALPPDPYAPPPDSPSEAGRLVDVGKEPSPAPASGATNAHVRGPRTFSYNIALGASTAMFIFIFMTTFIAVFTLLRFSISVLVITAVAALWEAISSGSFPDRNYFTKTLIEYLQAGAAGACIFAAAFGLVFALAGLVSVFSLRVRTRMKEVKERRRALREAAKDRKPTRSCMGSLYASVSFFSAFFIVIGLPAFRWWYGGGLELLMQDPKRTMASAAIGDVLVSLYRWARIYIRGEGKAFKDTRRVDSAEKAGVLEQVVVGSSNV